MSSALAEPDGGSLYFKWTWRFCDARSTRVNWKWTKLRCTTNASKLHAVWTGVNWMKRVMWTNSRGLWWSWWKIGALWRIRGLRKLGNRLYRLCAINYVGRGGFQIRHKLKAKEFRWLRKTDIDGVYSFSVACDNDIPAKLTKRTWHMDQLVTQKYFDFIHGITCLSIWWNPFLAAKEGGRTVKQVQSIIDRSLGKKKGGESFPWWAVLTAICLS